MRQLAVNEYQNLFNTDWNHRAFSARVVEREILRCLLEGVGRTPSHLNEQPWSFIVTAKDDSSEYERLLSCLADASVEWAKGAPVLMLAVVRLNHSSNGSPNRHAFRDVRHAISNLALRAKGLGLVAHQLAGFDSARAHTEFQIPVGYASTSVIALGYTVGARRASSAQEPESNGHRPLESFVFKRSWGQPSPLLIESSRETSRLEPDCRNAGELSLAVA